MWNVPEAKDVIKFSRHLGDHLRLVSEGCNPKSKPIDSRLYMREVSKLDQVIETPRKTISNLEAELVEARAAQASILSGAPILGNPIIVDTQK